MISVLHLISGASVGDFHWVDIQLQHTDFLLHELAPNRLTINQSLLLFDWVSHTMIHSGRPDTSELTRGQSFASVTQFNADVNRSQADEPSRAGNATNMRWSQAGWIALGAKLNLRSTFSTKRAVYFIEIQQIQRQNCRFSLLYNSCNIIRKRERVPQSARRAGRTRVRVTVTTGTRRQGPVIGEVVI